MTKLEKKVNSILRRILSIENGVKVLDLPSYNNGENSFIYVVENGVDKKLKLNSVQFDGEVATVTDIQANTDAIAVNAENILNNSNSINDLKDGINANEDDIQDNTDAIQANTSDIQQHNGQIGSLQNRVQDIEYQANENTEDIATNGIISSNESFVNAGIDYTDSFVLTSSVVHIEDGSVLSTDKDCIIHHNSDSLDTTVYVKKDTELYKQIENHKTTIINMFNNTSFDIQQSMTDVITRKIKEVNFQAIITHGNYQDFTINGVEYRLYNNVKYNFADYFGSDTDINVDTFLKATHHNKFQELSYNWDGRIRFRENTGDRYTIFNGSYGLGYYNIYTGVITGDTKGFNFNKKTRITGVNVFGKFTSSAIEGIKFFIVADKNNDENQRVVLFEGVVSKGSEVYDSFNITEDMLNEVYENTDFTVKVFMQKDGGDNSTYIYLYGGIKVFYKQIE